MKKNLEHSVLPSSNEIKLYQEGKLEALRSHEIEILAQENPLLADALEGYSAIPSYSMLPVINSGVAQSSGLGAGAVSGSAAAAAKIGTAWWHFNGWVIGIIAGTTAAVSITVLMNNSDENIALNPPTEQTITQTPADTDTNTETITESEVVASDMATQQSTVSAHNNSTLLNPVEDGNASQPLTPATTDSQHIQLMEAPAQMELPVVGVDSIALQPAAPVELPGPKKTAAILIRHILNYEVADYTAIVAKGWEKFSMDDVGLPANFGSTQDRKKYLEENPDKSVPYFTYITECISAYDHDKYKVAIDRFSVVLDEYPNDVNAQFYSAMSYYKLGEYDNAIALFNKVEKNYINSFDEEAMFYHAKSLQQSGQLDEANSLFVKVVQENGFYKEQAIKEMK